MSLPCSTSNFTHSPGEPLEPPSRDVTKAENALISNRQSLSLSTLSIGSSSKLPARPSYGTQGRAIVLRCNYFQIIPEADLQIFRYHVQVTPEPKPVRKGRRAFELLLDTADFLDGVRPAVATDYRSMLVTRQKLDLGPEGRTISRIVYFEAEEEGPKSEQPLTYTFQISYSNTLAVQELLDYVSSTDSSIGYTDKEPMLQALNVAMSRKPSSSPGVSAPPRTNKFFPQGAVLGDLGGGLIALRGYYTSVRTATLRLLANVNSVTATFYRSGSLLDLMRDFQSSCQGPWQLKLHHFLKGVRVETTHLKTGKGLFKRRVLAGLARSPYPAANAKDISFYWDEKDSKVTIEQYFQRSMHSLPLYTFSMLKC